MATSTGASNPPMFLYRNNIKNVAQISKPDTQANIVMVSRNVTTAKESLESVQREDKGNTPFKRLSFENADRNLHQKGVLLSDQPKKKAEYSSSSYSDIQSSNVNIVQNGGASHLNGQLQCVGGARNLDPTLLSFGQREGPSSPDSGYGNTPDGGMKGNLLSPSSRSRSSSSETTATTSTDETNSTRRTPVSSGVPSSLWSGHESTLEFVAEGDGEEEEENYGKSKETSSNSDDEGSEPYYPHKVSSPEPDSSILGPLPNIKSHPLEHNDGRGSLLSSNDSCTDSYFNPDDHTLVKVGKRKGIPRSSSVENDYQSEQYPNDSIESFIGSVKLSKTETRRRSLGRKRAHSVIRDANGRHVFLLEGKDTFQIQDELGKDNYHFTLSEALLLVIEEYKSLLHEQAYNDYLTKRHSSIGGNSSSDTLCSPIQVHSRDLPDYVMQRTYSDDDKERVTMGQQRPYEDMRNTTPLSARASATSLHQKWLEENYRADITKGLPLGDTVSVLRLVNSPTARNSAERTANDLLQHIAKVLGGNAQVEFRAPQEAIQLPSDFIASIQREELLRYLVSDTSVPIRGGTDWAPPRPQVIHSVYPFPSNIKTVLVHQGGRCAGCGMIMDVSQPKSLRFCNYTGKLFCVSCHHNAVSCIPGYIISKWSFKRLPVSNFARDTLTNIEKVPSFNIGALNSSLYDNITELNKVKMYRTQLIHLRKYIASCSRAETLQSEYDDYCSSCNGDIHIYSLNDLMLVKSGYLSKELKDLIAEGEKHVKSCLVCQGKGFVCEFCQNDQSIIFPFQLSTTSQCPNCHSCFHKSCYNDKSCPRCERIKERQQQQTVITHDSPS